MTKIFLLPLLLLLLLTSVSCEGKSGRGLSHFAGSDSSKFTGTIPAPEFPENVQWVNTSHPLSMKELRGKVVLLDFWTYGCINCYHIIPALEKLKEDFGNALVIIGVHSAKFKSTGKIQNIREAVLRWGVKHPVVDDEDFKIWNEYGVRAWPTLVLIDPAGKIVGKRPGEGIYEVFHQYIAGVVKTFEKKGELDRTPLNLTSVSDKVAETLLYFPGKLLADAARNRLFISDTDHNRIVITTLDGKAKAVVGNGKAELKDGSWEEASFNQPQGLTRIGNKLYVADTGNHAVRVINLDNKTVTTLAGNGKQAQRSNISGKGRNVSLNSPWAITHINNELFVAMAGSHQVWKIDPKTGYAEPFAGSRREGLGEGKRGSIPMAQPSGITTDGKYLYIAEPEASAIQRIGLGDDRSVKTLVGQGLFVFGDKDGKGSKALLQHDLGVVYQNGNLYVADTYNNKIKKIDLGTGRVSTFAGNGQSGYKDGAGKKAEFDEPGGLSIAGNWLYVTDTNNHRVRKVNLKTQKVETVQLSNLGMLKIAQHSDHPKRVVKLPAQSIGPDANQVSLSLAISDTYHFNLQAPNEFTVYFGESVPAFKGKKMARLNLTETDQFPLSAAINLDGKQPQALYIDVNAYFCKNGGTLCRYTTYRYKIPLEYSKSGDRSVQVHQKLQIPKLSGAVM